jgi:hypothetical protein
MPKCSHCFRRFRSKAAEQLAERRRAVILDLQGERPAEHLRPPMYADVHQCTLTDPDRHARHQLRSAEFRAGRT